MVSMVIVPWKVAVILENGFKMGSRISCVAARMERLSLDLPRAAKNIMGCGSLWNL